MKKTLSSLLVFVICLTSILFCGCTKKPDLPSINVKRYFESPAVTTVYNQTTKKNVSLAYITASKPNKDFKDKYVQYEFTGVGSWLYKMYIDSIYFYVYTDKSNNEDMQFSISLTNTKKKSDMSTTLSAEEFTSSVKVTPKKNNSTLCKVKVNRVIATATATKLSIDILETASDTFFENGIKWQIYGLEIFGESRTYR